MSGFANAAVIEKLRLLLVREREPMAERQARHAQRAWMERVLSVTAAVSTVASLRQAWALLAEVVIEQSSYELAIVVPDRGLPIVRGVALDDALRAIEPWRQHWNAGVEVVVDGDPTIPWMVGGTFPLEDRRALLVLGRTQRTAPYFHPPWDPDIDQVRYLVQTLRHVLTAVALRDALTHERNNLQVEVEHATHQLREALCDAQAARDAAEEASAAKSQFLATMSHELRTPLNAIIGYTELLAEDLDDTVVVADLTWISISERHLLTIIADILDLARIESGKVEVTRGPVPTPELLQAAVDNVMGLVLTGNTELTVSAEPGVATVQADPGRLKQVLINLLSNAFKFTEGGEIRHTVDQSDDRVWLRVADTGIGTAPEHLERLFEPFVQVDGSSTRRFGGGPGPGDLPSAHGADGGRDRGGEHARRGQHVLGLAARERSSRLLGAGRR